MLGCASAALVLGLWRSAYLCRIIASALLAHADAIELARDERKIRWEAYSDILINGKSGFRNREEKENADGE